jgi:tetratricopeptide (TPR) repeat protein
MSRLAEIRRTNVGSQYKLYSALQKHAAAQGEAIPPWPSMKTRISKWENGHDTPGDFYMPMLCAVLGVDSHELGFADSNAPGLVVPALAVTPEVVGFLQTMFEQYARADRMLGPRVVINVVREQIRMIDGLVSSARDPVRTELLRWAARYFEFGGWLAQDSGDLDTAEMWSARAFDMAYVFMRRSNIATELGKQSEGLGLARSALRAETELSPRVRALIHRQEAWALALARDELGALRAIDRALELAAEPSSPEPATEYCTPSYIQMEGASAMLKLNRPERAGSLLSDALNSWPAEAEQRDKGIALGRLSITHAESGEVDQSCAVAEKAIQVVENAPSARAFTELQRLEERLKKYKKNRQVVQTLDRIQFLSK